MATFNSAVRSTVTAAAATLDLVGSIAQTGANHAKIWELESAAKLEQRTKDIEVMAKADSVTYKQSQALRLMQSRVSISNTLKTQVERDLFEACLKELS